MTILSFNLLWDLDLQANVSRDVSIYHVEQFSQNILKYIRNSTTYDTDKSGRMDARIYTEFKL